jgi:hypothetical protein
MPDGLEERQDLAGLRRPVLAVDEEPVEAEVGEDRGDGGHGERDHGADQRFVGPTGVATVNAGARLVALLFLTTAFGAWCCILGLGALTADTNSAAWWAIFLSSVVSPAAGLAVLVRPRCRSPKT